MKKFMLLICLLLATATLVPLSGHTTRADTGKYIDVTHRAYGAKGDGVKDCTNAFQRAFDMAAETNRSVWVPYHKVSYSIRDTLYYTPEPLFKGKGLTIICDKNSLISMDKVGGTLLTSKSPGARANGMSITGCLFSTTNAAIGLDLDGVKNSYFANNHISSFSLSQIDLHGPTASYSVFSHNKIIGGMYGMRIFGNSTNENYLHFNRFAASKVAGLHINSNANHIVVDTNSFESCGVKDDGIISDCIYVQGASPPGAQGTTITNNRFESNNHDTRYHIAIDPDTPSMSYNIKCRDNEFFGGADVLDRSANGISCKELE